MKTETMSPGSARTATDSADQLFLSPQWIYQVARAVESARGADPYLQQLLTDYSLGVTYIIRDIPVHLRQWYGEGAEALLFVQLHQGTVRRIAVGGKSHKVRVDLVVTTDYGTARKLFLGKAGAAATILSGRIKAVPRNDFRRWPKLAARSLVTVNRVLKIARTVPTVFD